MRQAAGETFLMSAKIFSLGDASYLSSIRDKRVAYLRASTDKQDLNHQKLEILEFVRKKEISIDEFVEITISSLKTRKQRRIDEW
jgi:hypothetical protein